MFCKEHQPVFLFIMCFYILIHRICDHFRILHRLYHGLCTGHYISGCENPRHGGLSICICLEQSPIIYLQLFIPVHDPILRSLRNRNNDTVSRNKPGSLFFFHQFSILEWGYTLYSYKYLPTQYVLLNSNECNHLLLKIP